MAAPDEKTMKNLTGTWWLVRFNMTLLQSRSPPD